MSQHALIDIGVNLTGSSFSRDVDGVIDRARRAGVMKMVVTGTDIDHSVAAIELSERYPDILSCTAGVHPHDADGFDDGVEHHLRDLYETESVVAVGECGLDYNRNYSTRENQKRAFERQLRNAVDVGKPVFLHQRDAHEDFYPMMREMMPDLVGGVAHCFTGTAAQAEAYLDIGLHIGVTGWICDERRAHDLREAVRVIPLDRVLLETDAPYLLPRDLPEPAPACGDYMPADKRRNEPCFLNHICDVVADSMCVGVDELALCSTQNATSLFDL